MTGRLNSAQPYALGLFRIVIGLLFACHGAASLFGVLGGAMGGGTIDAGTWPGWY
ncbi:MAG: DoxX family protein, partial [Streptomyces sp.]